jgi:hypothetical protein
MIAHLKVASSGFNANEGAFQIVEGAQPFCEKVFKLFS